jgi:starch phosphorylase
MDQNMTEAQILPRPFKHREPLVAYFSMEIALRPEIPTYSGGLGVLAGDTIRAAADLRTPMVAVSLLYRKGYFRQRLDASGWQTEEPFTWPVEVYLNEMTPRVIVHIEGRSVQVRAWKYKISGPDDFYVPVYLLDTDLPENSPWDRTLTDCLYGGDHTYRLCQEAILGLGGVRMVRALGYEQCARFHMNEGHAGLLTIELLQEQARKAQRQFVSADDIEAVRQQCIFTTHTPVAAGHDQFPMELVTRMLGLPGLVREIQDAFSVHEAARVMGKPEGHTDIRDLFDNGNTLNLTLLALNLSHYINGVAKKHGEVSRLMFSGYGIDAITNGVHGATWTAPALQSLYDRYIPGWRDDNYSLRYALGIPHQDIWRAHMQAKQTLLDLVNRQTYAGLDPEVLTIGFARRMTTYKRVDLVFRDLERLKSIAARVGPLQFVYAGKAHPQDFPGKEVIKHIFQARDALQPAIKVAYLANYDMALAKLLTAGVDLWLNTPQPPLEASGTSGMKAALNGVPSLSILDGWWIEGCIEDRTGWAIGERYDGARPCGDRSASDAASLYEKLEYIVIPIFQRDRERFVEVMRHAIALNGSFFNSQRMVQQYIAKAYFL